MHIITPESVKQKALKYIHIDGVRCVSNIQEQRGDGSTVALLQLAMTDSLEHRVIYINNRNIRSYDQGQIHGMIGGGHIYNEKYFTFFDADKLRNSQDDFFRALRSMRPDGLTVYIDHHAYNEYMWHEFSQMGTRQSLREVAAVLNHKSYIQQFIVANPDIEASWRELNGEWQLSDAQMSSFERMEGRLRRNRNESITEKSRRYPHIIIDSNPSGKNPFFEKRFLEMRNGSTIVFEETAGASVEAIQSLVKTQAPLKNDIDELIKQSTFLIDDNYKFIK